MCTRGVVKSPIQHEAFIDGLGFYSSPILLNHSATFSLALKSLPLVFSYFMASYLNTETDR